MLTIVNYKKDEYTFPALLVLGCFDAIHIGHAELLKKAKLQAKINGLDLGVMMFNAGKGGRQLYSFEERCAFLEKYNVKFVLNIDFTDEFKKTTAAEFLETVESCINVKGYMSGKDFRFGAGAKGKSATLKKYAEDEDNGVWYTPIKDVVSGEDKVSTTLIKQCLEEGKINRASELLGRNFAVKGTVCEGHERGAAIGIPTANMAYPENKSLVKQGVYGVEVSVDDQTYKGVANFGARPTFGEEAPVLETYLLGYEGNLYGKEISVSFLNYIRDIHKFEDSEALCKQIEEDMAHIGEPDNLSIGEPAEDVAESAEEAVETPVEAEPVAEASVAEPATEEVTKEVVEEPAATEETTEAPVEEPIEEIAEVAEEVVEAEPEITVEEVTETEAESVVEEPVEEVTEEVVEEVTEEPVAETSEEVAEEVAEPVEEVEAEPEITVEEVTETEAEPVAEELTEEPVEEVTEEVVEEATEEPVAETSEEVAEEVTEEVAEPVEEVAGETVEAEPEITVEEVTETEAEPVVEAEPEITVEEVTETEVEPASEEAVEVVAESVEEVTATEPEITVEEVTENEVEPAAEPEKELTPEELAELEFEREFALLLAEEEREKAAKNAENKDGENND